MKLLKPVNDQVVIRDPNTRVRVPMEGVVRNERDPFWARRLRENSMTAEDAPPKPAKATVLAVEPPALGPADYATATGGPAPADMRSPQLSAEDLAGKTLRVKAIEE